MCLVVRFLNPQKGFLDQMTYFPRILIHFLAIMYELTSEAYWNKAVWSGTAHSQKVTVINSRGYRKSASELS